MFNGFYLQIVSNNSDFVWSYTVEYLKLVYTDLSQSQIISTNSLRSCQCQVNCDDAKLMSK